MTYFLFYTDIKKNILLNKIIMLKINNSNENVEFLNGKMIGNLKNKTDKKIIEEKKPINPAKVFIGFKSKKR
jgi:hypothetical protein